MNNLNRPSETILNSAIRTIQDSTPDGGTFEVTGDIGAYPISAMHPMLRMFTGMVEFYRSNEFEAHRYLIRPIYPSNLNIPEGFMLPQPVIELEGNFGIYTKSPMTQLT